MNESKTVLKIEKDQRLYELHLSNDSPLGEVFDVLTEMRAYILNKMKELSVTEAIKTDQAEEIPKD
jgi:hypothetical protein